MEITQCQIRHCVEIWVMDMKERVLVIDDDKDLRELLKLKLGNEGFMVFVAEDGASGIEMVKIKHPRIVVLDVNMPGMSGMDVCRFLKSDKKSDKIPVLMLTAKSDEVDRILGLEFGADDYLTKPFNPRELILRIKNILKRSYPAEEESKAVQYGVLSVHLKNHEVMVKNKPISLTLTEFKLLASLIVKPDQVKTRDFLLEQIWEYGDGVYSRTVDTHVQRLRAKLKDAGRYIETVRGVGYRISDEK